MPYTFILSFHEDICLVRKPDKGIVLLATGFSLDLDRPSPGIVKALELLCAEGGTSDRLNDLVLAEGDWFELAQFNYYLAHFSQRGMICQTLVVGDRPVATLIPCSTTCKFELQNVALDTEYVLSRFAYIHRVDDRMILESPLSPVQIILVDGQSGAILAELAKPQTAQQLNSKVSGWIEDDLQIFLAVLLSAGMLNSAQAETCSQPEDHLALSAWEFHDLLFHFRSRKGRHLDPVGKTFHRLDQFAPLPVVKPMVSKQQIHLYTPNLDKLKETDVPFSQVLEARRSIRIHSTEPLSADQIGEFLYRCARVRDIFPKDQREASSRPYPSGGACYELELYLIITGCEGIPAGLYHYCPHQHCLEQLSELNSAIAQIAEEAKFTAALPTDPQILIVITARFARVSWLYQSMAYSLVLKHVGVLYQTMYLVATAMQLAPCAVGTGNSDLLAFAADIDPYAEPAVGEFILGSKPLIEI